MEEQVVRLADKAWDLHTQQPPSHRLLIAIAGMPGSGKTTLAARITSRLNARFAAAHPAVAPAAGPLATTVPMDGYHLTRAQLSALPDPQTAHARRGAPFTFDARAYLALVRRLRRPVVPEEGAVWAPAFDHAVKDPVARGVEIGAGVRVVLFEGNYVGMEDEGGAGATEEVRARAADDDFAPARDDACWALAKALMDEVWYVQVDEDVARGRLARRHVAAGIVASFDEGVRRADDNDLVNGREIERRRGYVHETVVSNEDGAWAPEAQGGVDTDT